MVPGATGSHLRAFRGFADRDEADGCCTADAPSVVPLRAFDVCWPPAWTPVAFVWRSIHGNEGNRGELSERRYHKSARWVQAAETVVWWDKQGRY